MAKKDHSDGIIGGIVILALGVLFLLNNTLDINIRWAKYWPVLLILVGLSMVLKKLKD